MYKTPAVHCPKCSTRLDAATQVAGKEKAAPKENDITVCAYCRTVLVVTPDSALRAMTAEEFVDLPVDARSFIKLVQATLKEANDAHS